MTLANLSRSLNLSVLLGVLGVYAIGCGGTHSSNPAPTASTGNNATPAASTGKPGGTSDAAKRFYEETKPDKDNDTDGEEPDVDDGKKPAPTDRDGDNDSSGKSHYDSDDQRTADFGHPASGTERATIAALVRRFYAAAAAGNGEKACSMLYSVFAEAVPEDYGTSPPGPGYARATTCPAVLTRVFAHFREQILSKAPKLQIAQVRVKRREGIVLLSFGALPERLIHVLREGRTWRIQALLDEELQ
jgi:hypothetical protein